MFRPHTQADLEKFMTRTGEGIVRGRVERAEQGGQADRNPYMNTLYNIYVSDCVDEVTRRLGSMRSHSDVNKLIGSVDPLKLAVLAIRTAINELVAVHHAPEQQVARSIANTIYAEEVLSTVQDIAPDLHFALIRDLDSKMSRSERHRLNVFLSAINSGNIQFQRWLTVDKLRVGVFMTRILIDIGFLDRKDTMVKCKTSVELSLAMDVLDVMDKVVDFVGFASPKLLPCIEPPKDWVTPNDGGYHTDAMRKARPCIDLSKHRIDPDDVPERMLRAVNRMQAVPWQVNSKMLEAIGSIREHFDVGDLISRSEDKPPYPSSLHGLDSDMMSDAQKAVFKAWKKEVALWYTSNRRRGSKANLSNNALKIAQMFKPYHRIYFVVQIDYRGRCYTNGQGLNPQGCDLQKGLLRFAIGTPLDTPSAVRWFKINGANKFGYDKAQLDERVKWVDENHRGILDIAADPVNNNYWTQADKPFQFLAWCFEYAEWCAKGNAFLTHLPVGLDGSCNGLQHYSAILRDEVGGKSTNLVPSDYQRDIYDDVAKVTQHILENECTDDFTDDELVIHRTWLRHGMNRTLVKRCVMTLPYGSTKHSCGEFIIDDYLTEGKAVEFSKEDYARAGRFLAVRVWEAILRVVVKGREGMDYLQSIVSPIIKAGYQEITWRNPIGFRVRQVYPKDNRTVVNLSICKGVRLRLTNNDKIDDSIDVRRSKNGIAPNFIHSCDSAHMMFVVNAMDNVHNFAMIHDDYGTTATYTEQLYNTIRQQFYTMYESCDPLENIYNMYKSCGISKPPSKGNLDLRSVLESPYFFC